METRRWTNPSQPQTLYMATFLLYIEAVLSIVFGGAAFSVFGILLVAAEFAGGFFIANEKRWGYYLAVAVSALLLAPFVLAVATGGLKVIFSPTLILYALFPVALFALLIHPMSREYQKIWFH
jgi:hypothetical protein